ncbi:MAG: Gfo/Idh/MocA family oxidoreductase [Lachnospiraceae bacterium]|nr:Gfo/Idh/MocA family oxidoreductase [Lachnospiraceae bacterium]
MSYQREFDQRIRVALVGIGSHAYRNILPVLHFLPVELMAVCNHSNRELAERTAKEYHCRAYQDTGRMYDSEELDAVLFCVSAAQHPVLMKEALKRSLHVWAEKPIAMFASQVEELIAIRGDKVAMCGYKKAFMPAVRKAIEVTNSPAYGNLESILAVYPMKMPKNGAQVLSSGQKTDWLLNGCHPLSVLLAIGGPVDYVISATNAEGHGSNLLFFKNSVVGNLHLASGPQPNEDYHLYAPSWHLQIANSTKVILERGIPFEYGITTSFVPEGFDSGALVWETQNCKATLENMSFFVQGMYDELKTFCDCILENRKPKIGSLEFSLEIMKIYEALLISNGKPVAIQ